MESSGDEVYFILNLSLKIDDGSLKITTLFSFRLHQVRHQHLFLQMLLI